MFERLRQEVDAGFPSLTGARLSGSLPLGHLPSVEDFADAAVFLASPRSRSITGTTMLVDCGAAAGR